MISSFDQAASPTTGNNLLSADPKEMGAMRSRVNEFLSGQQVNIWDITKRKLQEKLTLVERKKAFIKRAENEDSDLFQDYFHSGTTHSGGSQSLGGLQSFEALECSVVESESSDSSDDGTPSLLGTPRDGPLEQTPGIPEDSSTATDDNGRGLPLADDNPPRAPPVAPLQETEGLLHQDQAHLLSPEQQAKARKKIAADEEALEAELSATHSALFDKLSSVGSPQAKDLNMTTFYQQVMGRYVAAVDAGNVALTVKSLEELMDTPMEMQGDADLYNPEALQKRFEMRRDHGILAVLESLWECMPKVDAYKNAVPKELATMTVATAFAKETSDLLNHLYVNYNVYRALSAFVFRRLIPSGTRDEFLPLVSADWRAKAKHVKPPPAPATKKKKNDSSKSPTTTGLVSNEGEYYGEEEQEGADGTKKDFEMLLDEVSFKQIMFELMDVWTSTLDIEEYLSFGKHILLKQARKLRKMDPLQYFDVRNVFDRKGKKPNRVRNSSKRKKKQKVGDDDGPVSYDGVKSRYAHGSANQGMQKSVRSPNTAVQKDFPQPSRAAEEMESSQNKATWSMDRTAQLAQPRTPATARPRSGSGSRRGSFSEVMEDDRPACVKIHCVNVVVGASGERESEAQILKMNEVLGTDVAVQSFTTDITDPLAKSLPLSFLRSMKSHTPSQSPVTRSLPPSAASPPQKSLASVSPLPGCLVKMDPDRVEKQSSPTGQTAAPLSDFSLGGQQPPRRLSSSFTGDKRGSTASNVSNDSNVSASTGPPVSVSWVTLRIAESAVKAWKGYDKNISNQIQSAIQSMREVKPPRGKKQSDKGGRGRVPLSFVMLDPALPVNVVKESFTGLSTPTGTPTASSPVTGSTPTDTAEGKPVTAAPEDFPRVCRGVGTMLGDVLQVANEHLIARKKANTSPPPQPIIEEEKFVARARARSEVEIPGLTLMEPTQFFTPRRDSEMSEAGSLSGEQENAYNRRQSEVADALFRSSAKEDDANQESNSPMTETVEKKQHEKRTDIVFKDETSGVAVKQSPAADDSDSKTGTEDVCYDLTTPRQESVDELGEGSVRGNKQRKLLDSHKFVFNAEHPGVSEAPAVNSSPHEPSSSTTTAHSIPSAKPPPAPRAAKTVAGNVHAPMACEDPSPELQLHASRLEKKETDRRESSKVVIVESAPEEKPVASNDPEAPVGEAPQQQPSLPGGLAGFVSFPAPSHIISHKCAIGRKLKAASRPVEPGMDNVVRNPHIPAYKNMALQQRKVPYVTHPSAKTTAMKAFTRDTAEVVVLNERPTKIIAAGSTKQEDVLQPAWPSTDPRVKTDPVSTRPTQSAEETDAQWKAMTTPGNSLDPATTHLIDTRTQRVRGKTEKGKIFVVQKGQHTSSGEQLAIREYEAYDRPYLHHLLNGSGWDEGAKAQQKQVEKQLERQKLKKGMLLEEIVCSDPRHARSLQGLAEGALDGIHELQRFVPPTPEKTSRQHSPVSEHTQPVHSSPKDQSAFRTERRQTQVMTIAGSVVHNSQTAEDRVKMMKKRRRSTLFSNGALDEDVVVTTDNQPTSTAAEDTTSTFLPSASQGVLKNVAQAVAEQRDLEAMQNGAPNNVDMKPSADKQRVLLAKRTMNPSAVSSIRSSDRDLSSTEVLLFRPAVQEEPRPPIPSFPKLFDALHSESHNNYYGRSKTSRRAVSGTGRSNDFVSGAQTAREPVSGWLPLIETQSQANVPAPPKKPKVEPFVVSKNRRKKELEEKSQHAAESHKLVPHPDHTVDTEAAPCEDEPVVGGGLSLEHQTPCRARYLRAQEELLQEAKVTSQGKASGRRLSTGAVAGFQKVKAMLQDSDCKNGTEPSNVSDAAVLKLELMRTKRKQRDAQEAVSITTAERNFALSGVSALGAALISGAKNLRELKSSPAGEDYLDHAFAVLAAFSESIGVIDTDAVSLETPITNPLDDLPSVLDNMHVLVQYLVEGASYSKGNPTATAQPPSVTELDLSPESPSKIVIHQEDGRPPILVTSPRSGENTSNAIVNGSSPGQNDSEQSAYPQAVVGGSDSFSRTEQDQRTPPQQRVALRTSEYVLSSSSVSSSDSDIDEPRKHLTGLEVTEDGHLQSPSMNSSMEGSSVEDSAAEHEIADLRTQLGALRVRFATLEMEYEQRNETILSLVAKNAELEQQIVNTRNSAVQLENENEILTLSIPFWEAETHRRIHLYAKTHVDFIKKCRNWAMRLMQRCAAVSAAESLDTSIAGEFNSGVLGVTAQVHGHDRQQQSTPPPIPREMPAPIATSSPHDMPLSNGMDIHTHHHHRRNEKEDSWLQKDPGLYENENEDVHVEDEYGIDDVSAHHNSTQVYDDAGGCKSQQVEARTRHANHSYELDENDESEDVRDFSHTSMTGNDVQKRDRSPATFTAVYEHLERELDLGFEVTECIQRRPSSGRRAGSNSPMRSAMTSAENKKDLVISSVVVGCPAYKAGLREGDRLLRVNHFIVVSLADLDIASRNARRQRPGTRMKLTILRAAAPFSGKDTEQRSIQFLPEIPRAREIPSLPDSYTSSRISPSSRPSTPRVSSTSPAAVDRTARPVQRVQSSSPMQARRKVGMSSPHRGGVSTSPHRVPLFNTSRAVSGAQHHQPGSRFLDGDSGRVNIERRVPSSVQGNQNHSRSTSHEVVPIDDRYRESSSHHETSRIPQRSHSGRQGGEYPDDEYDKPRTSASLRKQSPQGQDEGDLEAAAISLKIEDTIKMLQAMASVQKQRVSTRQGSVETNDPSKHEERQRVMYHHRRDASPTPPNPHRRPLSASPNRRLASSYDESHSHHLHSVQSSDQSYSSHVPEMAAHRNSSPSDRPIWHP